MPDNTVKYFDSTMPGAPSLSGTAGALIGILTACLQDGFGSVTVDSLVVASDLATATVSGGHGWAMIGHVGPVIRISGASPGGLNADVRVTVTSATQFTFATSGIADQTATGTISAKRAPAGWSIAHSDTNKAAFKADSVEATGLLLRVDDTQAIYARVIGYESMTGIDAGTNAFPAANLSIIKSTAADSTTRPWRLIADHRLFYCFVAANSDVWWDGHGFGDIASFKAGDAFQAFLCANTATSSYGNSNLQALNNLTGKALARAYTQTGGTIAAKLSSHASVGGMTAYPSPVDNRFYCAPTDVWESTNQLRGILPGLYCPLHNAAPADGTVVDDVLPFDRTFFVQSLVSSHRRAIDLTGPWR
ncbi:MAG: hypothetical protein H6974_09365 [Gammaproteobacteria bacterium]|nr:hypothetical protein [Gammaproteobacteria bacterium]